MTRWHRVAISGGVLLVLGVGIFSFVPRAEEVVETTTIVSSTEPLILSVRDTSRRGVRTFAGSLSVPNACTTVSATASLSGEGEAQQVELVLTTVPFEGVCLQISKEVPFSAALTAASDLPVVASLNGVPVSIEEL